MHRVGFDFAAFATAGFVASTSVALALFVSCFLDIALPCLASPSHRTPTPTDLARCHR